MTPSVGLAPLEVALPDTGEVAELLDAAWPTSGIRMDRDYLGWLLRDLPSVPWRTSAAVARDQGRLVGFAGAAPASFITAPNGAIVSWVAVHPMARGQGLASLLYRHLLDHLATVPDLAIHTFAQEGTRGAALIEASYPAAGWHGTELEPLRGWGGMRRRIRPDAVHLADSANPTPIAALEATTVFRDRLGEDPRVVAITSAGIRIVTMTFNGADHPPVGALDGLPATAAPEALEAALDAALRRLDPAIDRIVAPNLPPWAAALAPPLGLRLLPGPAWRNWVFTRRPDHPVHGATRTTIPVI